MLDGTKIRKKNYICVTRDARGKFISGGLTGIVELLNDGTILKSPQPGPDEESYRSDIEKEAEIYRLLGSHDRLVWLLGHSAEGLVLEYMPKRDLKEYLRAHRDIPMQRRLMWAHEAAEALHLLHYNGIVHCDVKPRNFLLDANLNLKIIDFSGSSIDGSKPSSGEGTRFYLPRDWRDPPTIVTDLFALGSTIYEIFTGASPYEDLASDEVERLYREKEFPDVSGIPCGEIIKQCWLCQVESAWQVLVSIEDAITPYV